MAASDPAEAVGRGLAAESHTSRPGRPSPVAGFKEGPGGSGDACVLQAATHHGCRCVCEYERGCANEDERRKGPTFLVDRGSSTGPRLTWSVRHWPAFISTYMAECQAAGALTNKPARPPPLHSEAEAILGPAQS
ncbi:hypothetical protein MRX96_025048 [Rhipicephalus microplus]